MCLRVGCRPTIFFAKRSYAGASSGSTGGAALACMPIATVSTLAPSAVSVLVDVAASFDGVMAGVVAGNVVVGVVVGVVAGVPLHSACSGPSISPAMGPAMGPASSIATAT